MSKITTDHPRSNYIDVEIDGMLSKNVSEIDPVEKTIVMYTSEPVFVYESKSGETQTEYPDSFSRVLFKPDTLTARDRETGEVIAEWGTIWTSK